MRVFLVVSAAVIVLGATVVPLPWAVVETGTLTPAADVIDIIIDPELDQAAGVADRSVSGEYLAVRHLDRVAAIHLLAAAADPDADVQRAGGDESPGGINPVVTAAMSGLGIVPRYADISEVPVSARVGRGVDVRSVGAALYAFDVGSQLDVAGGRRILGLGRVLDGGSLVCTPGIAAAARAAAEQGIDVLVVPTDCAAAATDALPRGATIQVLDARGLASAAEALLETS